MMSHHKPHFFFLLCTLFFFVPITFIYAQGTAGVRIQPSIIEESSEPGEVIDTNLTFTNLSDTEQTYYFLRKDITGISGNNVPVFAEEGAEITGFELSEWLTIPEEPLTLPAGGEASIPLRITIPDDASPGSHFGGVFVSVQPPRLREIGAAVGYDVGAIVSIRIAGDVIESARIREFSTDRLIYSKPEVLFTARIQNPGNVLLRPRGPLEINNMFGKRVGILTVNDSLAGVFPGTTRSFEIEWLEEGIGFGRYQAVVGLLYGEAGRQSTVSATVSFWILPAQIILPILGGLAFIILVGYIAVRLYIRRTISEISTTRGTRRVATRRRRKEAAISRLAVTAVGLLAATALFFIALLLLFA